MPHIPQKNLTLVVQACLLLVLASACTRQPELPIRPRAMPAKKTEVSIAAVGDIMMPAAIQKAVALTGRRYDLLFEKIAPDLRAADITFANLETQVDHKAPVSGYPRFNAGPELLSALKKAGIGIVSVANNHALDMGPAGLIRTLDNIEAARVRSIGAGRTRVEAERAVLLSANTITAAFLAYTYGTNNGMPRKRKHPPVVNILRAGSEADLAHAAARVRQARTSADLVIVSLHWSDEYRTKPTVWQRRAATELIEAGADVILGHHPHVLQAIESHATHNGRVGLIAFSLGNFISSQNYGVSNGNRTQARARRGDGIILTLYAKKEHGATTITRAEFLPIWTNREKVGAAVITRPVTIAREIARLEAQKSRTSEEEGLLALLGYRQKVILEQLTVKPVQATR